MIGKVLSLLTENKEGLFFALGGLAMYLARPGTSKAAPEEDDKS